jgi:hypothetical protein
MRNNPTPESGLVARAGLGCRTTPNPNTEATMPDKPTTIIFTRSGSRWHARPEQLRYIHGSGDTAQEALSDLVWHCPNICGLKLVMPPDDPPVPAEAATGVETGSACYDMNPNDLPPIDRSLVRARRLHKPVTPQDYAEESEI